MSHTTVTKWIFSSTTAISRSQIWQPGCKEVCGNPHQLKKKRFQPRAQSRDYRTRLQLVPSPSSWHFFVHKLSDHVWWWSLSCQTVPPWQLCQILGEDLKKWKVRTLCIRTSWKQNKQTKPFHSWEWSMSNFSCSPTRNITSHSKENLAFHSLLRWKMIIIQILATPLMHFLFKRLGECTSWAQEWKG